MTLEGAIEGVRKTELAPEIKSGLKVSDYIAFPQEFLKEGMKTTHEEIPMSNPESMPADGEMPEGMDGLPADGTAFRRQRRNRLHSRVKKD